MGIKKSQFFDLISKYDYLIPPEQIIYEFLHRDKYLEKSDILMDIIKKHLLSESIANVYNPNNFFLGFADCFAEIKNGGVYLIEFDIKSCTKLINKISSKDIYAIKAFIFNYVMKYLRYKTRSNQIYSFDYSKNDDGFIIINSGLDINIIRTYLVEIANFITTAISQRFPQLDYSNCCAFGFSVAKLGKHRSLSKLYASFEDKTNVRLDLDQIQGIEYTPKYFIAFCDENIPSPDLLTRKICTFLQTPVCCYDYFGGTHCKPERLLYQEFGNTAMCAINIKFNNFSGLNNLTGNKIYSHLLFQKIIDCVYRCIKSLDGNIYFIGLNSCLITMPEKNFDFNLISKIKQVIDYKINNKKIFNFFNHRIPLIDRKLRFKNLISKKGFDNGITISNINKTSMETIKNKNDLLDFKIKSYCGASNE
ncbi:MAG: hypothetical protein MJ187_03880 [Alphaproteobacteria bacterium]|nr:hypothetical protein [Alphaproteobacteria bacterium]